MKLTDKQRIIFSEILIKNLEFTMETESPMKKWRLSIELRQLKSRLKRSMGKENYEKFITQGKQAYGITSKT